MLKQISEITRVMSQERWDGIEREREIYSNVALLFTGPSIIELTSFCCVYNSDPILIVTFGVLEFSYPLIQDTRTYN